MRMRNNFFLACLLALVCCASCDNDKVIKQEGPSSIVTPTVGSFSTIQAELPLKMSVTIQKGAQAAIKLRGLSNILDHIKTKVENNILFITSDVDGHVSMDSKDIVAEVTMPELKALYLSFSANAEIHGTINETDFKTDISGNSTVSIDDIKTDKFFYKSVGNSKLDVYKGTTRLAIFSSDGDNKINAYSLQATEANVSMKGQGKCEISAVEKLTTDIGSSCALRYKGHPKIAKNPEGGTVYDAN